MDLLKMEESDDDDRAHESLLSDIKKLSGNNLRFGEEKQIRLLSDASAKAIDSKKLLSLLGDEKLSKRFERKTSKTLVKPLEKPAAKRLKRAIGYGEVVEEVSKWEGVVNNRRTAEQLTFPLEKVDLKVAYSNANTKPTAETSLQKNIYSLLYGERHMPKNIETEEEKEMKRAMNLNEVKELSKEAWKQKLLRQRLERKSALKNKSKSRIAHKISRKEKLRKEKEEFVKLKERDPESAIEILDNIERSRIKERMDLKHRNSKWIHLQQIRAGQDPHARQLVNDTAGIGRELLKKYKKDVEEHNDDDDDESDDNDDSQHDLILKQQEQDLQDGAIDSNNPWASQLALPGQNEEAPEIGFRKLNKFWDNHNKMKEFDAEAEKIADQKLIELQHKKNSPKKVIADQQDEENSQGTIKDDSEKVKKKKKVKSKKVEKEISLSKKKKKVIKTTKSDVVKSGNKKLVKKTLAKGTTKVNKGNNKRKASSIEFEIDDIFDETEKKLSEVALQKLDSINKQEEFLQVTKTKGELNKKKIKKQKITKKVEFDFSNKTDGDDALEEGRTRLRTLEDIKNMKAPEKKTKVSSAPPSGVSELIKQKKIEPIDLNDFDITKIKSRKLIPDRKHFGQFGDVSSDEEDGTGDKIDDDIYQDEELIKEFEQEKKDKDEEEKKRLNSSNFIKGWGSWHGPGIKERKPRKQTSYANPNKHTAKPHVMYNEKADVHQNIRNKMVSDLPYPFNSVKDFESSIRQPIGRQFVPEVVHRTLIAKPIVKKMGTIIKPMSEEVLVTEYNQKSLLKKIEALKSNAKRKQKIKK